MLGGTHGVERIYGDAVVHQFAREFQVVHSRILHREVETVGKWCSEVVVIDKIETVGEQHVFHKLRAPSVLLHVVEESVRTIARRLHQCRHSVLHAVCGAAGEGVHEAVGEEIAKLTHAEVRLKRRIDAMVEFVAYAANTDALTCVGKCL